MPVRLIQPSFAAGELSPSLHGRIDLAKSQVGLKRARNVFIHAHGGASNRSGLSFVAEVKDSARKTRAIPFQFNTTQTYVLEFGHQTMRVIMNGGQVVQSAKTIEDVTQADPGVVTVTGHGYSNGDEVFITGVGGMTELNGRNFRVADMTTDTVTLVDLFGEAIDTTDFAAFTSGGTVARVYQIATPYGEDDIFALKFVQSADVMWIVHPSYQPYKLSRSGHDSWTLQAETYGTAQAAPTNIGSSVQNNSNTNRTYRYVVTAVNENTGEESVASSITTIDANPPESWPATMRIYVTWDAASGATRYNVYRETNGFYGYVGGAKGGQFTDTNNVPDTSLTPPLNVNPFPSANNYPSCVTFHQQRLLYGATNTAPAHIKGSQISNFDNFNISRPSRPYDAVEFTLVSRSVNRIQSLVSLAQGLVALTTDGEFVIDGGSADAITPTNIRVKPQGYRGAAALDPVVIGDTVLFVQEKGSIIRDLGYQFAVDGYTGNDLTILANHLFEGRKIISWAYAQSPYGIVWAVRDDGILLSLTYLREHDVYAWTWHDTNGLFEDVTVISENGEDVPYFVVKREINGQTKRYIERGHTRLINDVAECFFVDSGLSYSGSPVTQVGGLHHLEGEEVVALADGNVVRGLTVENGAVTLPIAASVVHVGLSYVSDIQTLGVEVVTRETGTQQGRKKRISSVILRLEKTRGLFVGPTEDKLIEWKQPRPLVWDSPIALFTGDLEQQILPQWGTMGSLWIRQSDPLPMTILAVMPEVTTNG